MLISNELARTEKVRLLGEWNLASTELWRSLDALNDAHEIYPGVTKRELLAHIAGWDAMVFDYFRFHVTKHPLLQHGYTDIDSANARFVATRMSTTVHDAQLECEINRFALLTLLEQIEDADKVIALPWESETLARFIEGAIDHERGHTADVLKSMASS